MGTAEGGDLAEVQPRLSRLLDYIVDQSKQVDPKKFAIGQWSEFKASPECLTGLPGVTLNPDEGGPAWLEMQRLSQTRPPVPDQYETLVLRSDDPNGTPPERNEAVLRRLHAEALQNRSPEEASALDDQRRKQADEAVARYTPTWLAWAGPERLRRQSIALYGELFELRAQIESAAGKQPMELVWGMGVSAWKFKGRLADRNQTSVQVDFQYPLVTQLVDIVLDLKSHAISVRPRSALPRAEFDAFGFSNVPGAAEAENRAKEIIQGGTTAMSPFDASSFQPILMVAKGLLCQNGRFEAGLSADPTPQADLVVTDRWVLFARPRDNHFLIDDVMRLQRQLQAGQEIPEGPAALVKAPKDEVVKHSPISFRGLCSNWRSGMEGAERRELYFPLPYNSEQEAIVAMLERAPGVAVQGPPGTGKTHTIANIICHYLATGRRVLVTSKGEHALKVLQAKIPEEVRPLTVALLTNDQEGTRQFQASIGAIQQKISTLFRPVVEAEIQRLKDKIEVAQEDLAGIDAAVDRIAQAQLSEVDVDGSKMRAEEMAQWVVSGSERFGWFNDVLDLRREHAPPLQESEAQALRDARRKLHQDLQYVDCRLPASAELPGPKALGAVHQATVDIGAIASLEAAGTLPPLRSSAAQTTEGARLLLARIDEVAPLVQELEERDSWVFELRRRCRKKDFDGETQALAALHQEIDALDAAFAAFLQRPVQIATDALADPDFKQAIERATVAGQPAFSRFFPSKGEKRVKPMVAQVRISGLPPASASDWKHVADYLVMHDRLLSFSVRWNSFAPLLGLPRVEPSVDTLRATVIISRVARQAHQLGAKHDGELSALAAAVFQALPATALTGGSKELLEVRGYLERHLTRADLEVAAADRAQLHEHLAGTTGDLSERLRRFCSESLGNPAHSMESIVTQYAEFLVELRGLEALDGEMRTVRALCDRVADAGGLRLAERLRHTPALANGDDALLPADWRDAWNWSRVKEYLAGIDGRQELIRMAEQRRTREASLARLYADLVAQAAWLHTKQKASERVLAALSKYQAAVSKIGKGTGVNAPRFRKDAQAAMLEAQSGVPCWIMSHAKISESVPADIGAFDLVIVDEASQSDLWALPAVMRGKKILVVGDDKQVSPTGGFLDSALIDNMRARWLQGQPFQTLLTPDRSLYDLASAVFAAHRVMLSEHFRCVQPIIGYSGRFYSNQLKPLRVPKAAERIDPPLVDVYLPHGARRGKTNQEEAEFIAAEVNAILKDPKFAGRTIGVVSLLGNDQSKLVTEVIQKRVSNHAELVRREFNAGDPSFFQGSERDIMFLTMVADPRDCTALSGLMFEQRFNVASSRARDRMYLVRSVGLEHLSPTDLRRGLLEHFAKPHADADVRKPLAERCESNFELQVLTALVELGYRVTPQVPAGGFRIDMVVEGERDVRLAIECDGDAFHGPDRWPHDQARQRILERAGWVFWRCFASAWVLRREEILTELQGKLAALGIEPIGPVERPPSVVELRQWPPAADAQGEATAGSAHSTQPTPNPDLALV